MLVLIKLDIKRAKGGEKSLLYFEKHHSSSGYGYKILGMVLVIKRFFIVLLLYNDFCHVVYTIAIDTYHVHS